MDEFSSMANDVAEQVASVLLNEIDRLKEENEKLKESSKTMAEQIIYNREKEMKWLGELHEVNMELRKENEILKEKLTWIKKQYEDNYTEDEIEELDKLQKCIYESISKVVGGAE